jgi:hypothetical protein
MSGAISPLLVYTFMMRTDITLFKYLFMVYMMTLSVGQIIQCPMMEQPPDNKLERTWSGLQ